MNTMELNNTETADGLSNADGGANYAEYGNTANQTLSIIKDWFGGGSSGQPNPVVPPVYTPPAPTYSTQKDQGGMSGTTIALIVGGSLVGLALIGTLIFVATRK
jgi:hypothetical protein